MDEIRFTQYVFNCLWNVVNRIKSQDEIQSECFAESFLPESQEIEKYLVLNNPSIYLAMAGRGWEELLIDPVKFGWHKTLRIMNIVSNFCNVLKHRTCHEYLLQGCEICTPMRTPDQRNNYQDSKEVLFRFESKWLGKSLSKKQLEKFVWSQGFMYYQSRIQTSNGSNPTFHWDQVINDNKVHYKCYIFI